MRWPGYLLSIQTDCLHAEALADALLDAGALAASIEDADAGTADEQPQFGEPGSVSHPAGSVRWSSPCSSRIPIRARVARASALARAGLDELPDFTRKKSPSRTGCS
jgi:ribosomal protein L11 methylase PrmA